MPDCCKCVTVIALLSTQHFVALFSSCGREFPAKFFHVSRVPSAALTVKLERILLRDSVIATLASTSFRIEPDVL